MRSNPTNPTDSPSRRLLELITGSWMSQAICVAAELKLAELLNDGARDSAWLAEKTGCHEASLVRLLNALCSIEILRKNGSNYELAPMGHLLRADVEGSLGSWAIWWGRFLWPVWGELLHSVETGESARAKLLGTRGFAHLESDPEASTIFNRALAELTQLATRRIVEGFDFSSFKTIVDVGGGNGQLLRAILGKHPSMRGVLFDLTHAIEGARQHLSTLLDRCEFVVGDFFQSIPADADAYIFKSVIHDWNDDDARRILEVCRAAMKPDAMLLLIEQIMPSEIEASKTHQSLSRSDLTMLVAHAASERDENAMKSLVKSSGFEVTGITQVDHTFCILSARPI